MEYFLLRVEPLQDGYNGMVSCQFHDVDGQYATMYVQKRAVLIWERYPWILLPILEKGGDTVTIDVGDNKYRVSRGNGLILPAYNRIVYIPCTIISKNAIQIIDVVNNLNQFEIDPKNLHTAKKQTYIPALWLVNDTSNFGVSCVQILNGQSEIHRLWMHNRMLLPYLQDEMIANLVIGVDRDTSIPMEDRVIIVANRKTAAEAEADAANLNQANKESCFFVKSLKV